MILNVKLSGDDLANVRFSVSPTQHLIIALTMRNTSLPAQRWWRRTRRHVPQSAAPLLELLAAHPDYSPDFLTPPIALSKPSGATALTDDLDAIRAVSDDQIRGEVLWGLEPPDGIASSVRALRDGDPRQRERLLTAISALFQACLADDWTDMRRRLQSDLARRVATLAGGGVGRMLADVHPGLAQPLAWSLQYADVGAYAGTEYFHELDGSGFLLSPNLFLSGRAPSLSLTPWQQPLVFYSADHGPQGPQAGGRDPLAALLGKGRTAALRAIGAGCTNGELARRLEVSAPAASQHASALRNAGLVTTIRSGQSVVHSVSVLGADLLEANPGR